MDVLNFYPTPQTSGFSYQSHLNKHDYNVNLIREKAFGLWPYILESLGVPVVYLKNKHGSCPICQAGKDRFRFDDKGKGLYFCNKCGSGDGFKLLQLYHGWNFSYTLKSVAQVLGYQSDYVRLKHISHYIKKIMPSTISTDNEIYKQKRYLNSVWLATRSISQNDPVDCYLKARGIALVDFPSVLRFHPSLPYYDKEKKLVGYFPAMMALVQANDDHGVTIHRTYLGNGCKANLPKPKKLMMPIRPGATKGAAIKLFKSIDGKLALAEGIETALAVYIATQIPAWATISAGGMEKIILPDSISEVVIAVDHDESGRGQNAAFILSQRLLSEGRSVKRVMPSKIGYDFADMLVEGCR